MIDLKPDDTTPGYDRSHHLTVRGLGALAEGQHVKLNLGESLVVGRSRHCGWSLKRCPVYLTGVSPGMREELGFVSVSRRHARITYLAPDLIEIENLSGNGTLVDGKRVDKIVLTDARARTHQVQLGPHGVVLELLPSLPL